MAELSVGLTIEEARQWALPGGNSRFTGLPGVGRGGKSHDVKELAKQLTGRVELCGHTRVSCQNLILEEGPEPMTLQRLICKHLQNCSIRRGTLVIDEVSQMSIRI